MIDVLIPVAFLVILPAATVYLTGGDTTAGPFQVALILSAVVVGAIFVLPAVGTLIGAWSMSGIIATMVHLGIQFINQD